MPRPIRSREGGAHCILSHITPQRDPRRQLGLDDKAIMAVVDFFNGSNSMASGLRIPYEPPVFAEQKGPMA